MAEILTTETTSAAESPLASSRHRASPRLADFRFAYRRSHLPPNVLVGFVRFLDALIVVSVGYAVFLAYVNRGGDAPLVPYFLVACAAGLATVAVFQAFNCYGVASFRAVWLQLPRLALGWTTVFALLLAGTFLFKLGEEVSRVWLVVWFAAGLTMLAAFRIGLALQVRLWSREGRLQRRAVIVGGGERAESLIRALESDPDSDIRICGVFDDRGPGRIQANVAGYPRLGNIKELVEFGRRTRLDMLIVSLPISAEARILQILRPLWVLPVDIRLSAHTSKVRFQPRTYSYIGNIPFIDIADRPIADWKRVQKWLFDKVIGLLALITLAPVMAVVAVLIKLDSKGPALFRQRRYGFNNELIEVFKFRSMYVDRADLDASKLVTKNDPRVTRVGRFIRKTSLDELPQLINVLRGELSLVGPRPHALQAKAADELYQDVVDGYFARHKVKPGLTGWAQINGWRGETDTRDKILKRVEHDLYYIENWSVFLDLYILVLTPFALLKAENAY